MTVPSFQDLPLASRGRRWNGDAAEKRVRRFTGAEDGPNARYRAVHLWYDQDKKDNFTSYKLLIADVVDGRLVVVPRGVMAAAGIMQGAHGGIHGLTSNEATRVRNHLAKYYAKMSESPPWEEQ